jgi:hypothetical protein
MTIGEFMTRLLALPGLVALRRLAHFSFFISVAALSLLQTACAVLPYRTVTPATDFYSKDNIVSLENGEEVYRLQWCRVNLSLTGNNYLNLLSKCEKSGSDMLVVRPKDWDFLREASATQENPIQHASDIFTLDTTSAEKSTFERPASASRNTGSKFAGFFGNGKFVWVAPDSGPIRSNELRKPASRYEGMGYFGNKHPRVPALVARDADDVWVFVQPTSPCGLHTCFSVEETLGIDASSLPEKLRQNFVLFQGNFKKDRRLFRIFRTQLTRDSHLFAGTLPASENKFDIDLDIKPRIRFNSFHPQVQCDSESIFFTWVKYILVVPMSQSPEERSTKYKGCILYKRLDQQVSQNEAFIIEPLQILSTPDPTDPPAIPRTQP